MRFKGTAILFVVFVVLGTFVYVTEFRGRAEREKQEEAKKKAIQVEQKDIVEIRIISPEKTITGVKKGEKQWEIASPAGIEADPDEWDQLASNFSRIEREETVATDAKDLSPFGLKDPQLKVAVKLAGGKTIELWFGNENPRKIYYYAKFAGSPEVFFTPSSWFRIMKKDLLDLRSRKVLAFEESEIDRVKIAEGRKEIALEKAGSDWNLQVPVRTRADDSEVSSFLGAIRFARVSEFPENPVDAKTAGLSPPSIEITLHDAKAKADRSLLIGKETGSSKYYARDSSRDTIFVIDEDIAKKARRPLFDWRDKTLARLERDKVNQVEIVRGTGKIELKKEGSDWELADGRKLQWDKVSSMFNTLEFDRAKQILDSPTALSTYGLNKPRMEVVFREGTNEILRFAFGSDSKDAEGVYWKSAKEDAVKVVSKDVFDKFNVKVEDLVEKSTNTK